jgi:hypothetical protein
MNNKEVVDDLEFRLLDLEIRQLKQKLGWDRTLLTVKQPPARSTADVPLQMRASTKSGVTKREIRTATGWSPLPEDRSQWPKWARDTAEKYDAYDRQRTRNGHLISSPCSGPIEIR